MYNQILQGDVLEQIEKISDQMINCIVTSPPYYGLRDYGLPPTAWPEIVYEPMAGLPAVTIPPMVCCLGQEEGIEAYVGHIVLVFRELWRVLRGDGVAWLNLGDSYASQGGPEPSQTKWQVDGASATQNRGQSRSPGNLKPKDLMGIPWRVAFALQADGWYLRSDVIWDKKNPMPESVTDRPTKGHEYVFLLAKSAKYWFDQEAIKEPANYDGRNDTRMKGSIKLKNVPGQSTQSSAKNGAERWPNKTDNGQPGRNKRTVWSIATKPFTGAKLLPDVSIDHFAVMPESLVEPCLLAGCPSQVCEMCGEPWVRVVEVEKSDSPKSYNGSSFTNGKTSAAANSLSQVGKPPRTSAKRTIGFAPTCQCCPLPACTTDVFGRRLPIFNATRPGLALDPFFGAGTVGVVAEKFKRRWLGIDLNNDYVKMAKERIARTQPALFAR